MDRRGATLLVGTGVMATALLLMYGFGHSGMLAGAAVVVGTAFLLFRRGSETELDALRRSIEHSASDISRVLQQWHDFHHSSAPDHVRDRTSHRPRLLDPDCGVDSVRSFHEVARSSEEFLRRLHSRIQASTSVSALSALLHDTDRLAARLDSMWTRARREAQTPDLR